MSTDPYPHYPLKNSIIEVDLINDMYDAVIHGVNERDFRFAFLFGDFIKEVVVSEEEKRRSEELTVAAIEKLKKRLAIDCPQNEKCKCSLDKEDCRLLHGWKEEGSVYKHSYPILGEYLPDLKKVVLYVKNIDVTCEEPTYKGVLSTYIHELFHAYFHYITEQKHAEYNYIREIEEAMAEFSTLVFLRLMKNDYSYSNKWEDIFDWASDSIGKKQNKVGNLPAYGFGRYLFEKISEDKAVAWINQYAERLGYIDEEDILVKLYKQMVSPCYPTEPKNCMELLRKILFETSNKPIQPREVKENDDGMDGLVLVDYTPPYDSFCWKGEIHIKYDLLTDEFDYCNGSMGRWNLSAADIARIKAFLRDVNNLRDFFDDRKAYSTEEAIKTEHYRAYTLHIKWKDQDKTITVGFGSTIPFKHPFY